MTANARIIFYFPHPRAQTKTARGERADRANVNRVAAVFGIEWGIRERDDFDAASARVESQNMVVRDFILEANAPRALDASFAVEHNQIAKRHAFFVVEFRFDRETRLPRSVRHRQILQRTLATLVTNRTIERVTREQKFDNRTTRVRNLGGVGANCHALGHDRRARGLRLGHPCDHRVAACVFFHLSIFATLGRANFDQAHTAHSDRL